MDIPNTISKIADNAIFLPFQEDCVKALMPKQLGVGVKIAADLLIMGLRMTLHTNPNIFLVGIDLENAYKKIGRDAILR